MKPSAISLALCSAGITVGGSSTAEVLPTASREANSLKVTSFASMSMIGLCPNSALALCSILLRSTNKAASVGDFSP